MPSTLAIRIEQMRQARRIHGGALQMCAAATGVRLARVPIPSRRLRERVFRTLYGAKYAALREDELEQPLAEYRSLNDLFTRGVRSECRPLAAAPGQWLCPCDGTVQDVGRLQRDTLLTLKGIRYSLDSLLPGIDTAPFHDGAFAVLFLSPADCHRVFSPDQAELTAVAHVPGSRLLVHPPFQRPEFPVYTLNERVILQLDTPGGRCLVVMIAGWGVGNITFPFDVPIPTRRRHVAHCRLPVPRRLQRGEWLATFELGSTVVLIAEPRPRLVLQLQPGQTVRYGQPALAVAAESHSVATLPAELEPPQAACRTTIIIDPSGRLRDLPFDTPTAGEQIVIRVGSDSVSTTGRRVVQTVGEFLTKPLPQNAAVDQIVVALPLSSRKPLDDRVAERCAVLALKHHACRIGIVSDYRAYFGCEAIQDQERRVLQKLACVIDRVFVVRPGAFTQQTSQWSNLTAALHPLVPDELRICRLDRDELQTAMEQLSSIERRPGGRVVALLGENRLLRDDLRRQLRPTWSTWPLTALAGLLRWMLVRQALGIGCRLVARLRPRRDTIGDTLAPESTAELLELCNPWNRRHIALAGYNTGVVHFGWKYLGRTVVKTVAAGRRIRLRKDSVDVDAGVTLKRLTDELRRVGRALPVLPNYSYVSAGTAYFVPIHGSGSAVSTLGEAIEQVLVYDPDFDRLRLLRRGDGLFERCMYDRSGGLLLLRLRLRTGDKIEYRRSQDALQAPTAGELWSILRDSTATNIEVRKSRATARSVQVFRYHAAASEIPDAIDAPRDAIGSLWDRLEENRLTSAAFHWFVRRFAFHVELFLTEHEFDVFWSRHTTLPLAKIQLRFMRRDGLPHSPCRDGDRIAADLFLSRRHRCEFREFLRQYLPHVRCNAGKHSL